MTATLRYGPMAPGSRFAEAYYEMPEKKRNRLRIPSDLVDLFGVIVGLLRLVVTSSEDKVSKAQIDGYFDSIDEETLDNAICALKEMTANGNALKMLKRFSATKNGTVFLERLLGADGRLLAQALNEDLAFLGVLFDQFIVGAMPVVQAWEDTLAVLNSENKIALSKAVPVPVSLLELIIGFENEFGKKMLTCLPEEMVNSAAEAISVFDTNKFFPSKESVRKYLNSDAEERIRLIDEPLTKKLRGSITALSCSEDGVSQAANSLIELIDRVLRDFATDDEIERWLQANGFSGEEVFRFSEEKGKDVPTKFGQCLCFLYGGGTVISGAADKQGADILATLYYYLAKSMTSARNKLQKIKHADLGTDEERAEIKQITSAILGVIEIAHRFCWIYKGELPSCFALEDRVDGFDGHNLPVETESRAVFIPENQMGIYSH